MVIQIPIKNTAINSIIKKIKNKKRHEGSAKPVEFLCIAACGSVVYENFVTNDDDSLVSRNCKNATLNLGVGE